MFYFKDISVAFTIFDVPVYWYGFMFLIGAISTFQMTKHFCIKLKLGIKNKNSLDNIFIFALISTVICGRLFFIIIYEPYSLFSSKVIFSRFQGMSFHGGILGLLLGTFLYTKIYKLPKGAFLHLLDLISLTGPIAMFIGRIGNLLNQEHMGKATTLPWSIVFSSDPTATPRHPSQIYESLLEGLFPLLILLFLEHKNKWLTKKPGLILGISILLQGISRIICEQFRTPDGYIKNLSIGTFYSIPIVIIGLVIIWNRYETRSS